MCAICVFERISNFSRCNVFLSFEQQHDGGVKITIKKNGLLVRCKSSTECLTLFFVFHTKIRVAFVFPRSRHCYDTSVSYIQIL